MAFEPSIKSDYGYRMLYNALPWGGWNYHGRPVLIEEIAVSPNGTFTPKSIANVADGNMPELTMFGFNLYEEDPNTGEPVLSNYAVMFKASVSNYTLRYDWEAQADMNLKITLYDRDLDTEEILVTQDFPYLEMKVNHYVEQSGGFNYITDAKKRWFFFYEEDYNDTGYARIGLNYSASSHSYTDKPGSGWGGYALDESDGIALDLRLLENRGLFADPKEIKDPTEDPDDPPDPDPPTPPGPHPKPVDPVPVPDLPPLSGAGAGFITLYKLDPTQMQTFANECFDDTIWDALKHYFTKPADFVAGISICPFTPHGLQAYKPKFGLTEWRYAYVAVDDTFASINCGDLYIEPFFNNFLDYNPYTKITIWLPYIGFRELNIDDIMGKSINVTYHVDCLSGACVAFVSSSAVGPSGPQVPVVYAQFNGNVLTQVPVDSSSMDSMVNAGVGLVGAGATAAALMASAGAAAPVAGAVEAGAAGAGGAAEVTAVAGAAGAEKSVVMSAVGASTALQGATANGIQAMKPSTARGGGMSCAAGYMAVQKPYIIKTVPRQCLAANYIDMHGYPANITGPLRNFAGYAEVDDIQLNDIPATIPEIQEIYQLLKGGILI